MEKHWLLISGRPIRIHSYDYQVGNSLENYRNLVKYLYLFFTTFNYALFPICLSIGKLVLR